MAKGAAQMASSGLRTKAATLLESKDHVLKDKSLVLWRGDQAVESN